MITGDIDRVREALHFIHASDRETWVKMAMAVKSEVGDAGFDVWDEWSQQDDSYKERNALDVWKSVSENGRVTAGTLFYEARSYGWRDDGAHQKPTREELAERLRANAERTAKDEAETARKHAQAAEKAWKILSAATPATAEHLYLTSKGVLPTANLYEIDASAAATILGYSPNSCGELLTGRLVVVPIEIDGDLSTLELIDGDGRKSAISGGAKAGGFWLPQALPGGDGDGLTLLIGEGVATVLTAKEASGHLGIAALSCGNLKAVGEAMRKLYPKASITILADLVKATGKPDPHAVEAVPTVGGQLAVPDFGADRPEGATDFNDMAALHGPEAVKRTIMNAGAPAKADGQQDTGKAAPGDHVIAGGVVTPYVGFAFVQVRDLLSQPKPIAWLIRGMFEQGALGQLFGDSGCGKSFLAIDWGCCIATGTDWQGKEVEPGAVFYIAGEGHAGIGRRARAWEIHNSTPLADAPFFVSTAPAALMDVANAANVARAAEALVALHGTPRLIIVDTLARNLGNGDENSNADIGQFISNIDVQLRTRFGAAVLIVHHTGHVEKERGRGGSALRAAMDSEHRLAVDGDIRTLSCTKAKESEPPAPMGFKLEQIVLDGWADEDGELMTSAVLVASDEKAKGKKSRLSGANHIAHEAFAQALSKDGQAPGPDIVKEFGKLLAPVRVVHEEVWRQRSYDMGISDGEQDAKQKAFSRSRKALLDMHLVSVWNGFYWRGSGEAGHRTETGHCPVLSPTEPDRTGHTPIGVSGVRVGTPREKAEENQEETEALA